MGVPTGAGGDLALESGVPTLDTGRGELLQWAGAQVRRNLLREQGAVALCGLRTDGAHGGPLLDALADILIDRQLGRRGVDTVGGLGAQAGQVRPGLPSACP